MKGYFLFSVVGMRLPKGFIVKPYREPTKNEAFTSRFEGPDGFFGDNPTPVEVPLESEDPGKNRKRKQKQTCSDSKNYPVI